MGHDRGAPSTHRSAGPRKNRLTRGARTQNDPRPSHDILEHIFNQVAQHLARPPSRDSASGRAQLSSRESRQIG